MSRVRRSLSGWLCRVHRNDLVRRSILKDDKCLRLPSPRVDSLNDAAHRFLRKQSAGGTLDEKCHKNPLSKVMLLLPIPRGDPSGGPSWRLESGVAEVRTYGFASGFRRVWCRAGMVEETGLAYLAGRRSSR